MLLKKCDATCKSIEQMFMSTASICVKNGRILDISDMILVWVQKARGFGLPEDVENLFLDSLKKMEKEEQDRQNKAKEEVEMSSLALSPPVSTGRRRSIISIDLNASAIVADFVKKKDAVTYEDIEGAVKVERETMKSLINRMEANQAAVEPNDVFGAIKQCKERLEKWIQDAEEKLWIFELKALLRGAPVRVRELQRLQMACGAARFGFIKDAQKMFDKGSEMIKIDDKKTMRK